MNDQELMNEQFSDDQLDSILEHFAESSGDLEGMMELCYKELLFIGGAANRAGTFLQDAVKLNLRLCIRYNQNVENYLRVKELFELSSRLENPTKVEIDNSIINGIMINSN
jgi:hypothetical protein